MATSKTGKWSRRQRREYPEIFPFVCNKCHNNPRFRLDGDFEKHVFMKHGEGSLPRAMKVKGRRNHARRRRFPLEYPVECNVCSPQRRFKLENDKDKHDEMVHFGNVQGYQDTAASMISLVNNFGGFNLGHASNPIVARSASSVSPTRHDHTSGVAGHTVGSRPFRSSSLDTPRTSNEFGKYVQDNIEPDAAYGASCRAVVNRLVHFLQNNVPEDIRPQEVIKGGSLGKGTAVKDRSDADLVVFLSNPEYNSIKKIKSRLHRIISKLSKHMKNYGECQVTGKTRFAVKVKLSCHDGYDLDVDILPTCDILRDSKCEIYKAIGDSKRDMQYYSAPLVELQRDFISERPTKLKTLIRVVKYWRKSAFEERSGPDRLPSSYPLELITIREWERANSPQDFDLRKGFYSVLKALENYRGFCSVWYDNYSTFPPVPRPYVMDPANPHNNVMTASNAWDEVANRARETISAGFRDLDGHVRTWN